MESEPKSSEAMLEKYMSFKEGDIYYMTKEVGACTFSAPNAKVGVAVRGSYFTVMSVDHTKGSVAIEVTSFKDESKKEADTFLIHLDKNSIEEGEIDERIFQFRKDTREEHVVFDYELSLARAIQLYNIDAAAVLNPEGQGVAAGFLRLAKKEVRPKDTVDEIRRLLQKAKKRLEENFEDWKAKLDLIVKEAMASGGNRVDITIKRGSMNAYYKDSTFGLNFTTEDGDDFELTCYPDSLDNSQSCFIVSLSKNGKSVEGEPANRMVFEEIFSMIELQELKED